jgi:hypothetical protein
MASSIPEIGDIAVTVLFRRYNKRPMNRELFYSDAAIAAPYSLLIAWGVRSLSNRSVLARDAKGEMFMLGEEMVDELYEADDDGG